MIAKVNELFSFGKKSKAREISGPEKTTVLIVEDDHASMRYLDRLLQKHGYFVRKADRGPRGVEVLKKYSEDIGLVLIDLKMPGCDGFEVFERMSRTVPGFSTIPVVAVTADALNCTRETCLEKGMDDFVAKPFTAEEIMKVVRKWMPPPFSKIR